MQECPLGCSTRSTGREATAATHGSFGGGTAGQEQLTDPGRGKASQGPLSVTGEARAVHCSFLQLLWLLARKILQKNKLQLRKKSLILWSAAKGSRKLLSYRWWLGEAKTQGVEIKAGQSIESFILGKVGQE